LTSVEELASQLAAMQQQMANLIKSDDRLPIKDELFLVFNPYNIRLWCSKTDCPHLGRESRIDMVKQPVDEDLADAMQAEEIEVPVVRVSEPRNGAHPLGILAVFGTEREAIKFVEQYYRRHREQVASPGFELQISRVDV